jgi:hypothetical protein
MHATELSTQSSFPEEQEPALQNLRDYLAVDRRIYDGLKADGKLEEVLLRAQWEKRN